MRGSLVRVIGARTMHCEERRHRCPPAFRLMRTIGHAGSLWKRSTHACRFVVRPSRYSYGIPCSSSAARESARNAVNFENSSTLFRPAATSASAPDYAGETNVLSTNC